MFFRPVSRTCTAPFDRIKIFLITRQAELIDSALTPLLRNAEPASSTMRVTAGARVTWAAIARIYAEGGVLGFWVGNGLSVAKIFPESAIKFFSYESAVCCLFPTHVAVSLFFQKRMFAKYWHHVDDPRDISSTSRFLAGGIGGITSQLSESFWLSNQPFTTLSRHLPCGNPEGTHSPASTS